MSDGTIIETSHQKDRPNFDPTNTESRVTYTTSEVASMFNVASETVRDWIKQGKLVGFKLVEGGPWRVRHADLITFANKQFTGSPAPS